MLLLKCTTTKSQSLIISEYLLPKQDHPTDHLNLTCNHTHFFSESSNFVCAEKSLYDCRFLHIMHKFFKLMLVNPPCICSCTYMRSDATVILISYILPVQNKGFIFWSVLSLKVSQDENIKISYILGWLHNVVLCR